MTKLFDSYIARLNSKIKEMGGADNFKVCYGVSAKRSLELCRIKNNSVTSVAAILAHGTPNELIEYIDFFMRFSSELVRIKDGTA